MKIVQVLSASTGGIGRHVASIVPRLAARGHDVIICCPPATMRAHGFGALGVEVRPLTRLARLDGADVVHAHGYKAGGLALPVARLARTPLVLSWHNAVLAGGATGALARLLQYLVARGASLTLGASSDLVAEAVRLGARSARLAPVAAPGLPPPESDRETVRAVLGVAPAEIAVLTVSRLAPQKNLGAVLDVAATLRDEVPLRFLIVGSGPEQDSLAARIARERLPVRLLGHRDDMPDLLRAADIALLTSSWEARALVAQEALLAGLPLVSTRVGGMAELVGSAAILAEPHDAAGLADAVRTLAVDPAARAALRTSGLHQAATWPDEDDVVDDLLAAYGSVVRR